MHQMALHEQLKAFMLVYGWLKKHNVVRLSMQVKTHKRYRYKLVTLYSIESIHALESLTLSGNLSIGSLNRPHR